MHYFFIAGEASGDLHGARVIRELRALDPEARFTFLGGDMMAEAAGHEPVIHYRRMAYMGFSEILRHLGDIRRNMREARRALRESGADRLVLIDYPSFNMRMAAYGKRLGMEVCYYISPKVWAWKEWRVSKLKKVVDRMLCILPFEVEWYAKRHDWAVEYVGNPSAAEVDEALAMAEGPEDFLKRNSLRDRPIIALLPGSRMSEIKNNLGVMEKAVRMFPQYRGVVAGAPGIDREVYSRYTSLPVVEGQTYALLRHSRAALVTSGTATLETALAGVPQVVAYRANGSKLAYKIMSKLLKVKYVSLPNLIADRAVVPEMLLHECTPDLVAERLEGLLGDNREERRAQLEGYAEIRGRLGSAKRTAAEAIFSTERE